MSFTVDLRLKSELCPCPAHISNLLRAKGAAGDCLLRPLRHKTTADQDFVLQSPFGFRLPAELRAAAASAVFWNHLSQLRGRRRLLFPLFFYLRALFSHNASLIKHITFWLFITRCVCSLPSLHPPCRSWGSSTSSPTTCSSRLSRCRRASTSRRWSRRSWASMCPRSSRAWWSPSCSTTRPREERPVRHLSSCQPVIPSLVVELETRRLYVMKGRSTSLPVCPPGDYEALWHHEWTLIWKRTAPSFVLVIASALFFSYIGCYLWNALLLFLDLITFLACTFPQKLINSLSPGM